MALAVPGVPGAVGIGIQAGRQSATNASKVKDAAKAVRDQIGKVRVDVSTKEKQKNVDLDGKAHFDKDLNMEIPNPHVHEADKVTLSNGKVTIDKKSRKVREATIRDVRNARNVNKSSQKMKTHLNQKAIIQLPKEGTMSR